MLHGVFNNKTDESSFRKLSRTLTFEDLCQQGKGQGLVTLIINKKNLNVVLKDLHTQGLFSMTTRLVLTVTSAIPPKAQVYVMYSAYIVIIMYSLCAFCMRVVAL